MIDTKHARTLQQRAVDSHRHAVWYKNWLAQNALALLDELDRLRLMMGIVKELAKCDPVFDGECSLCGIMLDRFKDGPGKHDPMCPWRMAREIPCPKCSDHEWKAQPNGFYRCTKCPSEKSAAEFALMDTKET